MRIDIPLFEGEQICLAPIDHEKDPEIVSRWTHDTEYLRMLSPDLARALSPAQVKKKYEKIEKDMEESKNLFYFTVRARSDDRLLGFVRLYGIEWSNGTGLIELGIGADEDRLCGYGSEALRLMLRYAFDELNLHRLTAFIAEYNPVALHVFGKAGFIEEVRRRQALNRDGRRWDAIHMGLLRSDWEGAEQ